MQLAVYMNSDGNFIHYTINTTYFSMFISLYPHNTFRSTRNPIKLALSFPRNTTIEQVLLKAVNVYNQYELQCVEEGFSSNPHNINSGDDGNGGDEGQIQVKLW